MLSGIFEDKLRDFNRLKEKYKYELEGLKEICKSYGYVYDEDSDEFIKVGDRVHVVEIYASGESSDTDFGRGNVYSELVLIEDYIYDKIKSSFKDFSVDNAEEVLDTLDYNDENILKKLYEISEISGDGAYAYIDKEDMRVIDSKSINVLREGVITFHGEIRFEREHFRGYLSFFDLDRETFEKNKFKKELSHEKYIKDNSSFKYFNY